MIAFAAAVAAPVLALCAPDATTVVLRIVLSLFAVLRFRILVYGYLGFLLYEEALLVRLDYHRGGWPAYRRQSTWYNMKRD